jgi:fluoroacetyl-CoA thioesterase
MFREMPEVLATGFMVGLLEWACIEAIRPHLDWPQEQTLGTHVDFSHEAATPPGLTVTVQVRLESVEGRKLVFQVEAHDGIDRISSGRHERFVIDAARFRSKVAGKAQKAAA